MKDGAGKVKNDSSLPSRAVWSPAALRWSKRAVVQRYARLGQRLLQMPPVEVAHRVRSALWKRMVPIRFREHRLATSQRRCRDAFLQGLGLRPQECLRRGFDQRFFFGPSQRGELTEQIPLHLPGVDDQIVARASGLGDPGIDLLGQRVHIVPGQVDWQADPQTQQRYWSTGRLEEHEANSVPHVDVKYVWEVNRHQYLPLLGQAFWCADEPRYARQAVALLDDWIAQNPVGQGVNWSSHLEVGMRALSWLWTLPYLLSWSDLETDFLSRWLGSLADHYHHLSRNLSVYTDPTNHLIGEATALWMLSCCLPELPGAQVQAHRAFTILLQEVERQVLDDGVNREQASSYHRFVLDFYLQIFVLCGRLGTPRPPILTQRLTAMLTFAAALAGDCGTAPMIGDSDDARGLPFLELVGWDFRDALTVGAVLFDRSDWKAVSGGMTAAAFWLLGPTAGDAYQRLPTRVAVARITSVFPRGVLLFQVDGSSRQK